MTAGNETLVIGGTGPTGPHVVNGLLDRGHRVTILHTGAHEVDEIPAEVEHLHTDPFSADAVAETLEDRRFDLAVVMYGRLRTLAPLLAGRVGRLVSIGGVGIYRGFADPGEVSPTGLPVPTAEDAPLVGDDAPRKLQRMIETEQVVFDHHPEAIHLRYPMLYGPRQLVPREWTIVRRILDGRRRLLLPDGGLTLKSMAYTVNAAHAVLCAVDRPEAGAGRTYNVADDRVLTIRQVVEVIAAELGHEWELVNIPTELAPPTRPLLTHWSGSHRVLDTTGLRTDLGYRDAVDPVEAMAATARWLVDHPIEPDSRAEQALADPFDYTAEDRLLDAFGSVTEAFATWTYDPEPGFGGLPRPSIPPSRD